MPKELAGYTPDVVAQQVQAAEPRQRVVAKLFQVGFAAHIGLRRYTYSPAS